MHEAAIGVVVVGCEKDVSFQLLDTAMVDGIWVWDDIRSGAGFELELW
jgi:hypothetical protein